MTVERFDGASGTGRDGARDQGLAPVTYLFGERSSRTPSNPTTSTEKAGTEKAGTEKAGTEKAGTEKAGTEKVGTEKAGTEATSTESMASNARRANLPTLASVFGELESQIEAQLAERRTADAAPVSDAAAVSQAVDRGDRAERDAEKARARAERVSMSALTRRGMSKREVERSLRARELDDDTVASELDRLEGVGLIDDMALAQNLVGSLQERKGLGRSAVAAELTRRLLAPAAIEYALDLIETGDELGRAREIAIKRAGQLRSYDRETAVRRLSAFLMRRGYSGSTVRAAVEHALPATPGSSVRFR
jgi:regulatory protein